MKAPKNTSESAEPKVVGLDGVPVAPSSLEAAPEALVDIYDFLTHAPLELKKGGAVKIGSITSKKFYFRVEATEEGGPYFIEALKTSEALDRGQKEAIAYTFSVYEGDQKKSLVSISLSGEESDLRKRNAPLESYIKTALVEPIAERDFLVQAGIARIVKRTHGGVEEIIYND